MRGFDHVPNPSMRKKAYSKGFRNGFILRRLLEDTQEHLEKSRIRKETEVFKWHKVISVIGSLRGAGEEDAGLTTEKKSDLYIDISTLGR